MRPLGFVALLGCLSFIAGAACKDDATAKGPVGPPAESTDTTKAEAAPGAGAATASSQARYDLNHVLITGQSNSVSLSGVPPLSNAQPFANLMFDTGVMPMSGCDPEGCRDFEAPTSFVPLVEGDRYFDYPVETCASGMANGITFLAQHDRKLVDHRVLVTLHGRSGNTYWCVRKGGCSYKDGYLGAFAQAMHEVEAAGALARARQWSYGVRAVAAVHGESDHYSYTLGLAEYPLPGSDGTPGKIADYADALVEWQADYESSIRAITGQKEPIPMFISQLSGWNDTEYSKVAQLQLEAHERAPQKVILVGPSYALETDQTECVHFTAAGERHLGEYFAKAYARVVLEGKPWEPLRPIGVSRDGAVITVKFLVPTPPLAIDTVLVAEVASYGFGYRDASGASATIASVAVVAPDAVAITLAEAPQGVGRLTYAQNQIPNTCIGTPLGARGNLRDSDTTPSQNGLDLHNWAVHFDIDVP